MPIGPVDWQTIHSRPLVAVPECWTKCGGGFCCSNDHPDFQFRLMPKGGQGTTILYLEDEYLWLKANGHVICGEENGATIAPMVFDYGGPRPLVLRHAPCAYLGRCNGKVTKPLLCRTYPAIPVFGLDGRLETTVPASIIDATFQLKDGRPLCPLPDSATTDALEKDPALAAALAHPRLILHTQAVRAFIESYRQRLQAWEGFSLSGPAFWQAWELAYLGRRLVDRERVAAHVLRTFAALAERTGSDDFA